MLHVDPAQLGSPRPAPRAAADGDGAASTSPRAQIERRIAVLGELADLGMEIARAATQAATTAPAPDEAAAPGFRGDPVLAYTRAARAVRQTFALQSTLLDDLARLDKAESLEAIVRKSRRRIGLQRLAEEALHAERPEAQGWELKQLADFTRERLHDADEQADILGRSFEEVVARICDDLDLSPAWKAHVVSAASGSFEPPAPAGVARGLSPTSSFSGAAEGGDPGTQQAGQQGPPSSSAGMPGPRACAPDGAPPEDDAEEADAFPEWPPPSG